MISCTAEMKSFVQGMLEPEESKRLGFKDGAKEVMAHPWFASINFEELQNRTIEPEFMPDITRANCETNTEDLSGEHSDFVFLVILINVLCSIIPTTPN